MPLPTVRPTIRRLVASLVLLAAGAGESVARAGDAWDLCASHAADAGHREGLPPQLLGAIAKVESGRWNGGQGAVIAWPWTVTAEGKGRFLPSRSAAVATVRALQARGHSNIDVGCMQVNLMHHGQAFADLDEAFDPAHNVGYAARFLSRLRAETRSWTKAIGRYHSRTPRLSGPYRLKVFRAWREERHRADNTRRRAQVAKQGVRGSRGKSGPRYAR